MNEEWRDIKGYEGRYQVSNLGRVKSLNYNHTSREKILKAREDKVGYLYLNLYKNNKRKTHKVHRLVAQAFIENPNNYPQVNHKDENKSNNRVENLEWCTHRYNLNYGTRNQRASEKMKSREFTEEHKNKISNTQKRNGKNKGSKHPKARKVQCITTGRKFNCIKEAAEYYNIQRSSNHISACCRGKYKYCGKHPINGEKLIWKYID